MNNTTRIYLALTATLIAVELPAHAQELDTQILLPDPLISTTSLTPFAFGKHLLVDPWPSDLDYQSLFLGTLAGTGSPTIWRIDPDPNATPAFSEFTVTPLDARFRFVTKLAYSKVEKALYAAGDVEVQNTKPKSTSLAWVVRQSVYDESGVAHPWSDSDTVVLVKGADSRAQGMVVDNAGNVYVCGRANDAKGNRHFLVRRKASTGSWSTVYDNVRSTLIPETAICSFRGSPTLPAAVLMVGNENNQWTIVRSLTGNSGTWLPVDAAWSKANSPAGAKNIAYDPQSGKIYVVGYRGTFGSGANGWVVRVSADGGQTWSGLLDAPCPSYSYPDAVTTDAAGNVLVIGQIGVLQPNATWVPQAHLVRCTNPTEILSWQSSFAGVPLPFDETNCEESFGQAITTDASGAIFATGVMFDWVDSRTSLPTKYAGNNIGLLRLTPVAP